jgi:hypothetical protein
MPFTPSSYSGYANAIVGKPLALVNVGWSIELAEPAFRPQNSLGHRTQDAQADLEAYKFKLKLGDVERAFDGLAGYFLCHNTDTDSSTDWSKLFTYFVPEPHPKVQELVPDAFLPLQPYYINPEPEATPNVTTARARKYQVTTMLLDPYIAVHGYSPVLPTKSLSLPLWTVQSAFDKMHAFFHVGPYLMTDDVPPTYDAATAPPPTPAPTPAPVAPTPAPRDTGDAVTDTVVTPVQPQNIPPFVKLPVSGKKGTWTWLQPYSDDTTVANAEGQAQDPNYATLPVQEDLGNVRYAPAPYTFVEGYLQLMGKLGRDAGAN